MKNQTLAVAKYIPQEIVDILGQPPILSTEDKDLYYATVARFAKDVAPKDIITWLMIKDLVDYRIEIARCRRFKLAIVRQAHADRIRQATQDRKKTLEYQLKNLRGSADAEHKKTASLTPYDASRIEKRNAEVEAWLEENAAAARDECEQTIKAWEAHLPNEEDFAIVFPNWIVNHDHLEKILLNAEEKFFGTLRQIERHIFGFGKALREELRIIEGEVLQQKIEAKTASA